MKKYLLVIAVLLFAQRINACTECYDVEAYDLEVKLDANKKRIAGNSVIRFDVLEAFDEMTVHLAENLTVVRVTFQGKNLSFQRNQDLIQIQFPSSLKKGTQEVISIIFGGAPGHLSKSISADPLIWSKDVYGKPWISLSSESTGSRIWWPHKDDPNDFPEEMEISIIFPEGMRVLANGELDRMEELAGMFRKWIFRVRRSINPANVRIHVGNYFSFEETYSNASGIHPLSYHVMRSNEKVAREHASRTKRVMAALEKYFKEYPNWDEGYMIIETPYRAFQQQVSNGDEPFSVADLEMVREVSSAWFGSTIFPEKMEDRWILNAFIGYACVLFLNHHHEEATANAYLKEIQPDILTSITLKGLPQTGTAHDVMAQYKKGASVLHTLRLWVDHDEVWFGALRALTENYRNKMVTSDAIQEFFNYKLGNDYSAFFKQYIERPEIPILEYKIEKKRKRVTFSYRWKTSVSEFNMPIDLNISGNREQIQPTTEWQSIIRKGISKSQIYPEVGLGLFIIKLVD